MKEIDVKKEEKKNIKIAITVVLTLIMIPILTGIWTLYNLIGTDNVRLKDITKEDKNELINMLNLKIDIDNIEFEKLETPKVYKDIYYKLYFSIKPKDEKSIKKNKYDREVTFKEIKKDNNKIKYTCTISLDRGPCIEILETIMNKY